MLKFVVIACIFALTACSPSRPERVTGNLSQEDLSRITETVRSDLESRKQSDAGRIKSIVETNGTVEVWYADKRARKGEAGYILARATNGWKITTELFR